MITPSFPLTAAERVLPKLALDFTTAVLDSRISFTRALNTATRVNSSGNIVSVLADTARFDYDPVTLACKGLLIEETRTNLVAYSNLFTQNPWSKSAGTTISTSSNVSPDGVNNAFQVSFASTGDYTSYPVTGYNAVTGQSVTISLYVRSANRAIQFGGASTAGTDVYSSVNAGNGWYRQSVTRTFTATTASGAVQLLLIGSQAAGLGPYSIWGAQLEAGAFATSYIPTTTTALTRNADVAVITGTNFSDFWQASKGGAMVQATASTVSGIRPLVQFDDGTADNIIALRGNATNPELQIVDGGAPQVQLDAGTIVANTPYSLTGWWATNDCKARQNSGATVSDYTATIPTVTQARLGSDGANYLNGTIATVNYYDSFFGQSIYTRRKNKVFASLL